MAFDPARILRASKIRVGEVRLQGVPAILAGAAGLVLAASVGRALSVNLPETIRELGALASSRRDQRSLNP